jgi:hypothetical protein
LELEERYAVRPDVYVNSRKRASEVIKEIASFSPSIPLLFFLLLKQTEY